MMNKEEDNLIVASVIEAHSKKHLFSLHHKKGEHEQEAQTRIMLRHYGREAASVTKRSDVMLGHGHPAEMIVAMAGNVSADYLVMGRRGLSETKHATMGSVSKYALEHAECNVLCVKGDFMEEDHDFLIDAVAAEEEERSRREHELHDGPAEEHDDKQAVLEKEEEERQTRVSAVTEGMSEVHINKQAVLSAEEEERSRREAATTAPSSKREGALRAHDLMRVVTMEELERQRRVGDAEGTNASDRQKRNADLIGTVLDEEEERHRRETIQLDDKQKQWLKAVHDEIDDMKTGRRPGHVPLIALSW
jgi:nucleotide-binding universal stress UspA family protein